MSYGDGSITEIFKEDGKSFSPKHWRICLSFMLPQKQPDGSIKNKRKKVQRNVTGTKAEARKVRDEIKRQYDNGLSVADSGTTFSTFADSWHKSRENEGAVGSTRLKREKGMLEDIKSYIGHMAIADITPQVVESMYSQMREDKKKRRGAISETTMNMIHKLLKQVLAKAVDYDLILRNPCDRVKAPKIAKVDRRSLTVSEGQTLLAKIDEAEDKAYEDMDKKQRRKNNKPTRLQGLSNIGNVIGARLGLATGMRRGEVVGLTWRHVNLEQGWLRVAHSVTVENEIKDPKSEAGKRVIRIDSSTVKHLAKWKSEQEEQLLLLGIKQSPDTPVCCSDIGEHMNPNNFSRWWRNFCETNKLGNIKFHELRHTQATQLVSNGVDLKTVQSRLGHSSATLTMNLYAHALPENDEKAASMIGSLFSENPKAKDNRLVKSA